MSLYMRPRGASQHTSDSRPRDTKFSRDLRLRYTLLSHPSYERDISLSEFSSPIPRAFSDFIRMGMHEAATPFGHLFHVLRASTPRQMLRIAAKRIVAAVKRPWFPGRSTPMGNLAGNSVRPSCRAVQPELPITIRSARRNPRPAFVVAANFNLHPESGDILLSHGNLRMMRSPTILRWENKNVMV